MFKYAIINIVNRASYFKASSASSMLNHSLLYGGTYHINVGYHVVTV